jgi:hypothetical protein
MVRSWKPLKTDGVGILIREDEALYCCEANVPSEINGRYDQDTPW